MIEPERDGDGYVVDLSGDERDLLASLPLQLVEILDTPIEEDDAIARLFPDAYSAADQDHADEFRRLMNDDLKDRHRASLELIASTAHSNRLTHDELYGWMTGLNQLRLVIGTRLGVTEDMDEDERDEDPGFGLYSYLSWLQAQVVEALSMRL